MFIIFFSDLKEVLRYHNESKKKILTGKKRAKIMTFTLRVPEHQDLKPRIIVFGVGGAGGNAVDNMILKT